MSNTLFIKFRIILGEDDFPRQDNGAIFHRWLPNGKQDLIQLPLSEPKASLEVWFERCGFTQGGFTRFDYKRRDVNPRRLPRQGALEGGPLFCLLKLRQVSKSQIKALKEGLLGGSDYKDLGKRVIRLIETPVENFIDLLRTHYGQYWVSEFPRWDSRSSLMGSYCGLLAMMWSLNYGRSWKLFEPGEKGIHFTVEATNYQEYITKNNWKEITQLAEQGYKPPVGAYVLADAHRWLDQGNLKLALIEGVTALEVVLDGLIKSKVAGCTDETKQYLVRHLSRKLISEKVLAILTSPVVSAMDLDEVCKAIEDRNRIVHEGWEPPEGGRDAIEKRIATLLKTTAKFLPGPQCKFPATSSTNALMAAKQWKDHYKRWS